MRQDLPWSIWQLSPMYRRPNRFRTKWGICAYRKSRLL